MQKRYKGTPMPGKALIVVDMLNDFMDARGVLYCGDDARKIIPFVQERLAFYRQNGDPVIYLQDAHDGNDKEFEKFPPHCVAGTWGSAIIPELKPQTGEKIIPKKRYSGFYGTDLENVLTAAGVDEVEVLGVCTAICVMDTVGGLANRDYAVTVPTQGVADFDPRMHEFALQRMQRLYGANVI
jgi:nicotinamidase/pyrazinamidase